VGAGDRRFVRIAPGRAIDAGESSMGTSTTTLQALVANSA
jgi:hypothetical protein